MTELHIDFETRSTVDLKEAGLDVYAKDPTTDAWCMAYAFDEEEVRLWTPDLFKQNPISLNHTGFVKMEQHIRDGGTVVAHNAPFELAIWNNILVPRYGFPPLKPEQIRCTMAQCYAMALPGSLEKAAAAVGIDMQKDMAGHRLMMQMAKPRDIKDGKIQWWDEPEKLERLYAYCKQDVEVERQLDKRLMKLSAQEQALWQVDYRINQRGVYIDQKAVKAAIRLVESEKARLDDKMKETTEGFVTACTNVNQITDWLRYRGVETGGVAKADIVELLATPDLPVDVVTVLRLRQEAAKSSTAKLASMLGCVSEDSRVRGILQYHGAGTGRWAGRRIQPQNFPRPKLAQNWIDRILDTDIHRPNAGPLIETLYDKPMDVVSTCLRGMICAAPGYELVGADFSAIEARVVAWLAGEERVLEVFRGHGKIYEHAAASIYHKPMEAITKDERQIGKVATLALGYQGGVGAFQTMARGYGVKVSDERADEIKNAWRDAHPNIVRFWYALEDAAMQAVFNAGVTVPVRNAAIKFRKSGSFLWCQLPNGRVLCYPYPKIKEKETPWGDPKDCIHYMTVDGLTNKWIETHTYGGKLCENVTQAVARDLLAEAIIRLEKNSWRVVLHVHDEVVCEIGQSLTDNGFKNFVDLVSEVPTWAKGLPISAEGWRGKRYQK